MFILMFYGILLASVYAPNLLASFVTAIILFLFLIILIKDIITKNKDTTKI